MKNSRDLLIPAVAVCPIAFGLWYYGLVQVWCRPSACRTAGYFTFAAFAATALSSSMMKSERTFM